MHSTEPDQIVPWWIEACNDLIARRVARHPAAAVPVDPLEHLLLAGQVLGAGVLGDRVPVGADRCLFGTEKPGSGSATNPDTGRPFDDLKPVIEAIDFLSDADRAAIFEGNAREVFPRLKARVSPGVPLRVVTASPSPARARGAARPRLRHRAQWTACATTTPAALLRRPSRVRWPRVPTSG